MGVWQNFSFLNQVQSISNSVYASPGHSLSIHAVQAFTSDVSSYWVITIPPTGISIGSELQLNAKVRVDNVTSGGGSIALRADAGSDVAAFKTTQNETDISGTRDFIEYSVTIPYFPENVTAIRIYFLFLWNSLGTVYFDDVIVTNKY